MVFEPISSIICVYTYCVYDFIRIDKESSVSADDQLLKRLLSMNLLMKASIP
jgi:hypothetical protein